MEEVQSQNPEILKVRPNIWQEMVYSFSRVCSNECHPTVVRWLHAVLGGVMLEASSNIPLDNYWKQRLAEANEASSTRPRSVPMQREP